MFTKPERRDKLRPMIAKQSKRDTKEKTVMVTVRVPESLRKELKVISAREDKSLNLLIEEIIVSYIKSYKPKKG